MSLHGSLKTKPSGLNAHRNVLTRAERVARLAEKDLFKIGKDSPFGIVKVANRMAAAGKKKKAEGEGDEGDAAAAPGAAPAAGAAAAGAKPAGGAAPKAAAPATKGDKKK